MDSKAVYAEKRERMAEREEEFKQKYSRKGFQLKALYKSWYYIPEIHVDRCPICGGYPTVEPFIEDKEDPPTKFVISCPYCDLRGDGEHSPEECVELWNKKCFSHDSLMVNKPLKPEDIPIENGKALAMAVVRYACLDIISWMPKLWEKNEILVASDMDDDKYWDVKNNYNTFCGEISQTASFLRNDANETGKTCIEKLKKVLYPEATAEQRIAMGWRFDKFPEWEEMKTLLELKGTENQKGGYSMAEIKARTKRFYTEYVNHMVRFFLSTEESLDPKGKSGTDIENWVIVQSEFNLLSEDDKSAIRFIFKKDTNIVEQVQMWCELKDMEPDDAWAMVYRFTKKVARGKRLI